MKAKTIEEIIIENMEIANGILVATAIIEAYERGRISRGEKGRSAGCSDKKTKLHYGIDERILTTTLFYLEEGSKILNRTGSPSARYVVSLTYRLKSLYDENKCKFDKADETSIQISKELALNDIRKAMK